MTENCRVRIDASNQALEVEGSEAFVREMLEKYAPKGGTTSPALPPQQSARKTSAPRTAKKESQSKEGGKAKKANRPSLAVDDELARQLRDNLDELKALFTARRKLSHQEEAAVIAWFLDSKLARQAITDTSYYTAIRVLGRDLPRAVHQVLIDAKNKRNFFNDGPDGFVLATPGINFAERESLQVEETTKEKR